MPPGIPTCAPPLKAAADILRQHPHASIEVLPLDLSRPASVVRFCRLMRSRLGLDGVMIGAEEGIGKEGEKVERFLKFHRSKSGDAGILGKVGEKGERQQQSSREGREGGEKERRDKGGNKEEGHNGGLEEEGTVDEEEEEEVEEEKESLWGQQQQQKARVEQVPSPLPPLCLLVNNAGILSPTASHRSAPAALPVDRTRFFVKCFTLRLPSSPTSSLPSPPLPPIPVRQLYVSDVASLAAGAAAPASSPSPLPIDPGMVRTAVLRELPSFLAATVNTLFSLLGLCLLPRALAPLFLRACTAPQPFRSLLSLLHALVPLFLHASHVLQVSSYSPLASPLLCPSSLPTTPTPTSPSVPFCTSAYSPTSPHFLLDP
ncbi:unnamed protein product [Closterium sp. Naga37s-1]|nr:unnamed protein product [Closterium sp. Naga37s-1]